MASLKRWWFERSITPTINQSHYFQGRNNQQIAIITDALSDIDHILFFMKKEKAKGNAPFCIAMHLDKEVPAELPDGTLLKKDIKWPGIPKGVKVDEFLSINFDVCYVLVNQASLPVEYLLRTMKCALKLGFYHKSLAPFLDFCAESPMPEFENKFNYLLDSSNKLLFGKKKPA